MCLIIKKFKRVQYLERIKNILNIMKKRRPLKNKSIFKVGTFKAKNLKFSTCKRQSTVFSRNPKINELHGF